jgi:hypothetical protein
MLTDPELIPPGTQPIHQTTSRPKLLQLSSAINRNIPLPTSQPFRSKYRIIKLSLPSNDSCTRFTTNLPTIRYTTLRHPPVHRQQPVACKNPPIRCTPRSAFHAQQAYPELEYSMRSAAQHNQPPCDAIPSRVTQYFLTTQQHSMSSMPQPWPTSSSEPGLV